MPNMRLLYIMFISVFLSYATEYHTYDLNTSIFSPVKSNEANTFDISNNTNIFLSSILERGTGADNTVNFIDFNNQSINIKNINLLYSNEYSTLLFQREFFADTNFVNYYNGLINRFSYKDFTLGFNGFVNNYQENNLYTLGSEFAYGNYFKFFTNYYNFKDEFLQDDLEFGLNFTIPFYSYLNIDLIKDNTKITQSLNYNPYPIFNISLVRQRYTNAAEALQSSTSILFNFNIFYNQSLRKQLKRNKFRFQRYNNYDFLKNRYLY